MTTQAQINELKALAGELTVKVNALTPCPVEPPVPVPVDCVLSAWGPWVTGPWSPCVNGMQTAVETRTCTVVTPPANGGKPCGPTTETRVIDRNCVMPVPGVFKIEKFSINMESMLVFAIQHASTSGYERFQNYQEITQAANRLSFHHLSMDQGPKPLAGQLYTLAVDGVDNATVKPAIGAVSAAFILDLATIPDGWHKVAIKSDIATETSAPWCVFVNRSGSPLATPPTKMPVCSGSYDWSQKPGVHFLGWTPPRFAPTPVPLAPRECPPIPTTIPGSGLFLESLVPNQEGNIWMPNVTKNGVWNTFNEQNYMWQVPAAPPWPMLDGPRGIGTVTFPTHLQFTHTGGLYFCEQHRFGKIGLDGKVTTLAGRRDKLPLKHWKEKREYEYVGDYSEMPGGTFDMHELWGSGVNGRTTELDPNAPPIIIGGVPVQPHKVGIEIALAASQNNMIPLLRFKKDSFDPPKVLPFITGLQDPWDVVWHDGKYYVSERKGHKITMWNADTGAFIDTLIQGPDLSSIDPSFRVSKWHTGVTLAQVRAAPVVAPEGMFIQDGWLYYGSLAMWCIKKINLTTGEILPVVNVDIQGNSKFVKFCLSDGTFGPRGMVAWCSWSNWMGGRPSLIVPGQPYWKWQTYARLFRGKGGAWNNTGYPTAPAIGFGGLAYGSSEVGICKVSQALPTDPTIDMPKYARGEEFYMGKGYHFTHGKHGYGYVGLPLPWGENADMDYYLTVNGLTQ